MRGLIGIWVLIGLSVCSSELAAQATSEPEPFQQVWLDFDPLCAETRTESNIASEIRLRIPEASVVLGAPIPDVKGWVIRWRTDDEGICQLDVLYPKGGASRIDFDDPNSEAEYELVASQVAWIVSMEPEPTNPEAELVPPPAEDAEPEEEPETKVEQAEEPQPTKTPEPAEPDYVLVPFKLSLFTNAYVPALATRHVPQLSLNLIGRSYGLKGVEVGMLYNQEDAFMHGVQLVMGANNVLGEADGVQMAMGANLAGKPSNVMQFSMGYNQVIGDLRGVQVGAGANYTQGNVRGTQVAFGASIAESVKGVQFAMGASIAEQNEGLQTAVVNVSGSVDGMQIGVVNVAEKVHGVQLGLVNISGESDIPIGLINVMLDEPVFFTAFAAESGQSFVGIQHGSEYLRYMYGASAGPAGEGDNPVIGLGVGIGVHAAFTDSWFVDMDLIWQQLSREDFAKQSLLLTTRLVGGYSFTERFAVYAGPSVNMLWSSFDDGLGLPPGFSEDLNEGASDGVGFWLWPGLQVGLRL